MKPDKLDKTLRPEKHTVARGGELFFVAFTEDWLGFSLMWLEDEEIRALTMAPVTTREKQRKWFCSLSERRDYLLWGVQMDGRKIGVVGLKNIAKKEGEYWGYIGEQDLWGKGLGKELQQFIVSTASEMGLKKLFLIVGKKNVRAIKSYEKFGFSIKPNTLNEYSVEMTLEI